MALAAFVVVIIALGTVALVIALRRTLTDPRGDAPAPSHPDVGTPSRWPWAGIVTGLVLAAVTISVGALGRRPLLASVAFGLCVLGGVLGSELRIRPADDALRAATLERRSGRRRRRPFSSGLMIATTAVRRSSSSDGGSAGGVDGGPDPSVRTVAQEVGGAHRRRKSPRR